MPPSGPGKTQHSVLSDAGQTFKVRAVSHTGATGGYRAEVHRVRLSDSGRTLKVTTGMAERSGSSAAGRPVFKSA